MESASPLDAIITGLERLAVPSLAQVTGIELTPVQECESVVSANGEPGAVARTERVVTHGHEHDD